MAIAIGQSAKKATTTGTATTDTVTTAASGSTFLIGAIIDGGSFSATPVQDSKSNTYTQIGSELTLGSARCRVYYCENGTGGSSHTATATQTGSNGTSVFFAEVTGGLTSGILDKTASTTDSPSPFSSGLTATTTQANELLVSFLFGNSGSNPATHASSGATPSTGWTIHQEVTDGNNYWTGLVGSAVVSSTGQYEGSWTESGASSAVVFTITLKEGSSGATAKTATASLGAAIQQAKTATASFSGAVRDSHTTTTSANAAVSLASTATSSVNAAIRAAQTATFSANAAVQSPHTVTSSLAAAVQAAFSATVSASAAVAVQSTLSSSVNAAISTPLTVTAGMSSAVQAPQTATANANAAVSIASSLVSSLNALITVLGESFLNFSVDAAVQQARSVAASLSAAVLLSATATASVNALVVSQPTVSVSIDTAVLAQSAATASLSAYIFDENAPIEETHPTGGWVEWPERRPPSREEREALRVNKPAAQSSEGTVSLPASPKRAVSTAKAATDFTQRVFSKETKLQTSAVLPTESRQPSIAAVEEPQLSVDEVLEAKKKAFEQDLVYIIATLIS